MRRVLLFAFAIAVLIIGTAYAQDPQGGGFLEKRPSWFVKVKVSELPLRAYAQHSSYTGSGTWVAKDLVVTCWHNYRDTWKRPRHEHFVLDHNDNRYEIEIAALDKRADLMILRVKGPVLPHSWVRVSTDEDSADFVTCYGMDTDGEGFRYSNGQLRRWEDDNRIVQSSVDGNKPLTWLQTNALVVRGMSGGPAIDINGELTGVNIGHYKGQTTMIRLSTVQLLLDRVEPGR